MAMVFCSYWTGVAGRMHAFRLRFTYLGVLWANQALTSQPEAFAACFLLLLLFNFSGMGEQAVLADLVGTMFRFQRPT